VYTPKDPQFNADMQFFETTARNRGLPYRVFSDIKKAKIWLHQD